MCVSGSGRKLVSGDTDVKVDNTNTLGELMPR